METLRCRLCWSHCRNAIYASVGNLLPARWLVRLPHVRNSWRHFVADAGLGRARHPAPQGAAIAMSAARNLQPLMDDIIRRSGNDDVSNLVDDILLEHLEASLLILGLLEEECLNRDV